MILNFSLASSGLGTKTKTTTNLKKYFWTSTAWFKNQSTLIFMCCSCFVSQFSAEEGEKVPPRRRMHSDRPLHRMLSISIGQSYLLYICTVQYTVVCAMCNAVVTLLPPFWPCFLKVRRYSCKAIYVRYLS